MSNTTTTRSTTATTTTRILLLVVGYYLVRHVTSSFVQSGSIAVTSVNHQHHDFIQFKFTTCCQAKRGNKGSSNNNKKVSTSKNKQKGGPKASSTISRKDKNTKKVSSKVALPSNRNNAPPWQVGIPSSESDDSKSSASSSSNSKKKKKKVKMSLLSDADRQLLTWKSFVPERDLGGVAFVGSYLDRRMPPRIGVPEVAFLGRSNVGKSSLLNYLTAMASKGTKDSDTADDQARVGKTPGATASVNLYALLEKRRNSSTLRSKGNSSKSVNDAPPRPILGFTDLPGFGYAKLSKENKQSVEETAERYLASRKELALGVLLLDARRIPSDDDRAVLAALYDLNVPLCIVATKVDKLTKNEVNSSLETIRKGLGLPHGQPLSISSVTGDGINVVWKIIMESCESHIEEINENLEEFGSFSKPDDFQTIQLDESGEFINDEDLQYDMGYDWVHSDGRSVMYEQDSNDDDLDDSEDYDDVDDEDSDIDGNIEIQKSNQMNLKVLNKRVNDMQKRGLL